MFQAVNNNNNVLSPLIRSKTQDCGIRITKYVLGLLILTGIVLAIAGHFSLANHSFVYWGSGIATASFVLWVALRFGLRNPLKEAIKRANTFVELEVVLDKSKYKTSCLGGLYLQVPGVHETVSVDYLADRISSIVKNDPQFNETEREAGKKIDKKITQVYARVDQSNCFIRMMYFIRGSRCDYTTRWEWDYNHQYLKNGEFDLYTAEQYKNVFGEPLTSEFNWGVQGYPHRWYSPNEINN